MIHATANKQALNSIPIDSNNKKQKPYSRQRIDEDISICLNCKRASCSGSCKKIESSKVRKGATEK